jgi:hypothetical protein
MRFERHSNLVGRHAFLSPSNGHWVNYSEEKLERVFHTAMAAQRGTDLHALAHQLIRLGVKLPESPATLNSYVNDAIGFRMESEITLYYSDNCFGSPDSLGFRNMMLRIHDLKTGATEASMTQLLIYAALFCLEYRFKPFEIKMELRIYQNDDVKVHVPDPDEIFHIMDRITTFDKQLNYLRSEVPS